VTRLIHGARGALLGATIGAIAGLADQLLRAFDPLFAASGSAAFAVVVYWASFLILPGFLIGLVAGRANRWADAVLAGLAVVILVGGYVNQRWLPSIFDPLSLGFDAVLMLVVGATAVLAARARYRFDLRVRLAVLVLVGILVGTGLSSRERRAPVGTGGSSPLATGPDIVVVLLDALRADHCSTYGYARETTPRLDQLAREGVRFDRAYSVSSWTKPVVATLFSGVYPARHGNHPKNALLPDDVETLPEILRDRGYRTAVFSENNFVSPLFGYAQGVERFEGSDPSLYTQTILGHMLGQIEVRSAALAPIINFARVLDALDPGQRDFAFDGLDLPDRVLDWFGELDPRERAFCYVHLLKPHAPYRVPAEFEGLWSGPGSEDALMPPTVTGVGPFASAEDPGAERVQHLVDNYDERIRFGDHQLGQIIDGLRAAGRDPLVVVLSDHGEEFGENGLFDHGHSLQEGVVRVPLVVSWPGRFTSGSVVDAVTRLIDLPASLLAWAGFDVPEAFDGLPIDLAGGSEVPSRPVLLELEHGPGFGAQGLLREQIKLVRSEQGGRRVSEVFDLFSDPQELRSLAVGGEDPLVWLEAELDELLELLQGRTTWSGETTIDRATEERLRALGYVN
jgi:arylsulfatase A-like enzyme